MKRNIRRTLLILFVSTFVVSTAATMQARGKDPQCTLAGAAGDWGFTDTGTVVGVGPRMVVGRFTLDAAGNVLNGTATANLIGSISSVTFTGTFTVKADCTGTADVVTIDQLGNKIEIKTQAIFVDNMREVHELFTSVAFNGAPLATVITLDAKRLFPEDGNEQ
jgi:hypothetical protein